MDAGWDAAAGDSGSGKGNDDACKCTGVADCYYDGCRYGLPCRWDYCNRDCNCELAGVYHRDWAVGAVGNNVDYDWRGGSAESAACPECRGFADGDLLHGGVSPERWQRE